MAGSRTDPDVPDSQTLMRRADRLFQIVQLLRRDRISTAAKLARELGVSERTLYRDIADLMASGVPIESEAGVGYSLPRHFDLPPFMFDVEEGEALLLGARIVAAWGDPSLRKAAESVLRRRRLLPPDRRRRRTCPSWRRTSTYHRKPPVSWGSSARASASRGGCGSPTPWADGTPSERVLLSPWAILLGLPPAPRGLVPAQGGPPHLPGGSPPVHGSCSTPFEAVAGRGLEDYLGEFLTGNEHEKAVV